MKQQETLWTSPNGKWEINKFIHQKTFKVMVEVVGGNVVEIPLLSADAELVAYENPKDIPLYVDKEVTNQMVKLRKAEELGKRVKSVKDFVGVDSINKDRSGIKMEHREIFGRVVNAIGLSNLKPFIPAKSREELQHFLKEDEHLNNIPLYKWDMRVLDIRRLYYQIGITSSSISDVVCTLKEAAKLWAEELLLEELNVGDSYFFIDTDYHKYEGELTEWGSTLVFDLFDGSDVEKPWNEIFTIELIKGEAE